MAICPICGQWIDKFDLELTGGHRECLAQWEDSENENPKLDLKQKICTLENYIKFKGLWNEFQYFTSDDESICDKCNQPISEHDNGECLRKKREEC